MAASWFFEYELTKNAWTDTKGRAFWLPAAVYTYWGPAEVSIEFGKGGDAAGVWQQTCDKIDVDIAAAK